MKIKELTTNKSKALKAYSKNTVWGDNINFITGRWMGLYDDNNNLIGVSAYSKYDPCFHPNKYSIFIVSAIKLPTFEDSQNILETVGTMSMDYLKNHYPKADVEFSKEVETKVMTIKTCKSLYDYMKVKFEED